MQADILDLLDELRSRTGMGMLLISHDLSVVADRCESISVMRQGAIVEAGPTGTVINSPAHPFTAELLHDLTRSPDGKAQPTPSSSARPADDPPEGAAE